MIAPGRYDRSLEADGVTRHYIVYVPTSYTGRTAVPVIFFFHGGNGSAESWYEMHDDARKYGDDNNVVIVFPNGQNTTGNIGASSWNAGYCCINPAAPSDVEFVRQMILALQRDLMIDTKRIHAAGFSNGGILSHRLAADMPDTIASIASAACANGGQRKDFPEYQVMPTGMVPILHAHGKNDQHVLFAGGVSPADPERTDYSFAQTIELWVTNNRCSPTPTEEMMQAGTRNLVIRRFNGCANSADVIGIAIDDWGHMWPSFSGLGTDAMFDFLLAHPKP